MADSKSPSGFPKLSGRSRGDSATDAVHDGSRVVPADYGMPGSPGVESPLKPLAWLLMPFVLCLAYGLLVR